MNDDRTQIAAHARAQRLEAINRLIAAVEDGTFRRTNGPRGYSAFAQSAVNAGLQLSTAGLMDAFHKGDAECAAFLKANRTQIAQETA